MIDKTGASRHCTKKEKKKTYTEYELYEKNYNNKKPAKLYKYFNESFVLQ